MKNILLIYFEDSLQGHKNSASLFNKTVITWTPSETAEDDAQIVYSSMTDKISMSFLINPKYVPL